VPENPYLLGAVLAILGGFLNIWVSFDPFLWPFFLFLSFFRVRDTVYSQMKVDHVLLVIRESF
jgi:hypothetical protein